MNYHYLDLEIRHLPPKPNYRKRKQKPQKKPKPSHFTDAGELKPWFPDKRCVRVSWLAETLGAPHYAIRFAMKCEALTVVYDTQGSPWVWKDLKYKRFLELVRADKISKGKA